MQNTPERVEHRMKIIEGQVRGLAKMIHNDGYCIDVLTQSLAIQNALKQIDKLVLESHLKSCVTDQMKNGEEDKATEELLKIFKLNTKNK